MTFRKEASAPQGDGTAPGRVACQEPGRENGCNCKSIETRKELPMASTVFIKADEVAAELGISKSLAYRMIHQWNEELKKKGYTTVIGRVSRQYYHEKVYGMSGEGK